MGALTLRARMLRRIRAFFDTGDVLEVDTPVLSHTGASDPHIESFRVPFRKDTLFLHTSPEYPMKRLLAAYGRDCYQIAKVFRVDESGARHNPEFTMLEWYRLGYDHHTLMRELLALVEAALQGERDLAEAGKLSYAEAFERFAGIDPHRADTRALAACADAHGLGLPAGLERDALLDALIAMVVAPAFPSDRLTLVYDFPPSQAALARVAVHEGIPVAERFELFWGGLELANGFHELTDAAEQRRRFEQDNRHRRAAGLVEMAPDERLLRALEAGLPACAGVALGIDRLLMLALDTDHIDTVLSFPLGRA